MYRFYGRPLRVSHRQGGEAVDGRESQRPRNLNVAELYKDLMCLDKAQAWQVAKWEHRWFGCDSVTGRGKYNHVESCVYVICVCIYICIYHKYTCSNPTDEDYFQILGWSTCNPFLFLDFLIYAHGAASYGLGFKIIEARKRTAKQNGQSDHAKPSIRGHWMSIALLGESCTYARFIYIYVH